MSKILYEVGIRAYKLGVQLASPFNAKAAKFIKGRENIFQAIETQLSGNTAPLVWFHCASLGEFEQGRPLIEGFRVKFPQFKIVLTFFSPSGYEVRKQYAGADYVFYLPLDTRENASRFVKLVQPKMAIFVKYEFWHHYTRALKKRGIPLISISAIFRKNQIYFRNKALFTVAFWSVFSHIYTQNQESAELLSSLNFTKVSNAGDTRADRVIQTAKTATPIPLAAAFKGNQPVMVVGSSWPEDMKVLLPFMQKQGSTLKFILAPHEIKEKELREVETQFPGQVVRYSRASEETIATKRILLIDNIGMLSQLYQYADYAYVGGAFGKGLHNTLEPAAFGPPLFFGPKYDKFQEAVDLVSLGAAFPVRSGKELDNIFTSLQKDAKKRANIKETAKNYIEKQAGATNRILTALEYWLPSPSNP